MASLKVAVRVRPFNQREIDMGAQQIVHMDGKKTSVEKSKLSKKLDIRENFNDFTFDYSYWSFNKLDSHFITQEQVYNDLGTDVIDCAFQGYNACVFAYGQTGSGKTFTMMGSADELGLIPRICKSMFNRMKLGQELGTGYKTHVSYLEIYNERVKDLLGPPNAIHGLRVREHRTMGPYVEDLSQHPVSDYDEIQECINRGNILRTTASTNMNDTSSRSHAIFTITFVQAGFIESMPSETVSKIHLVDLAGSERANATGATGQRLKEGAHINKSLVTLGSVISALAEQTNPIQNKRILYIPYRDSVLTWLLKDSLGGNSKTIMIAAISPADCNYSETLSTLRYANRAKNIINKPTINEDPNVKLIRELREEIMKLKGMLSDGSDASNSVSIANLPTAKMLEDLLKKEAQEKVLTEEWQEKWREAQSILREQKALGLRKSGVGVVLDSEMPHLIGIHDDVSTGVTLYSLKEGDTTIGTDDADECPDIVLHGLGIHSEHCSIILKNGNAMIVPRPNAQCLLNANLIDEPTAISQGDILLLGRTNMFRYNNPAEAAKMRKAGSRSGLDLSRLSLIAASRENLTSSMYCYSDDELAFAVPLSKRQYCPSEQFSREDPELQDEHRKILETIESALKQLNIERIQMHEQYKDKVNRLSTELLNLERLQCDRMAILNCRERELFAKKEMLFWEKNNAKTQTDIVLMQISTLQTQLDSKKRDFYEYVAKELQELQDFGKLDQMTLSLPNGHILPEDSSQLLMDVTQSLDNVSSQFICDTVNRNREDIKKLELELQAKSVILNESSNKLQTLDVQLQQIDIDQNQLLKERTENYYETMKMKKQSFVLNIKPNTVDSNVQTDTFDLFNTDIKSLETCDTFHTANSDCSTRFSTPSNVKPSTSVQQLTEFGNINNNNNNNNNNTNVMEAQSNSIMSDSGVSLGTHKTSNLLISSTSTPNHHHDHDHHHHHYHHHNSHQHNNIMNDNDNIKASSTTKLTNLSKSLKKNKKKSTNNYDNVLCSSQSVSGASSVSSPSSTPSPSSDNNVLKKNRPLLTMHAIRQKIAAQKAQIMKNLEMNSCDKMELDEQIAKLQELQKQYFQLEKEFQMNGDLLQEYGTNYEATAGAASTSSSSSSCDDGLNHHGGNQNGLLIDNKNTDTDNNNNGSSAIGANTDEDRLSELPSPYSVYDDEFCVSIPSFVIRGAGQQTHYEYEVRISLPNDKWVLLRRYSRFRELHLSLKNIYGEKISEIQFPRRKLFATEMVAKVRRRQLELYLRRLFVVCSKIPQCPIFEGSGGIGLNKCTLAEFSPFFKRGLFESGKHGTG